MKRPQSAKPAFADAAGAIRQIRLGGRFTPGVMWILGLYVVTFVLLQLPGVGDFLAAHLLLQPAQALGVRPYQLLSGPLFMTSFFSLLFLGILLWSVGSAVEDRLGTRRFLVWAGLGSLASAIAAAGIGRLLPGGQSLLVVALDGSAVFQLVLVAFAHFYGDVRVTMWGVGQPISGRALSYFFVGLGLAADLLAQRWPHLAAAAAAVLCTLLLCRGGRDLTAPFKRLFRSRRMPKGMQVLDGGRSAGRGPQRWVN
jgi:membrane associated rhomboid family serine protease